MNKANLRGKNKTRHLIKKNKNSAVFDDDER
jgi:hypothetical protein